MEYRYKNAIWITICEMAFPIVTLISSILTICGVMELAFAIIFSVISIFITLIGLLFRGELIMNDTGFEIRRNKFLRDSIKFNWKEVISVHRGAKAVDGHDYYDFYIKLSNGDTQKFSPAAFRNEEQLVKRFESFVSEKLTADVKYNFMQFDQ